MELYRRMSTQKSTCWCLDKPVFALIWVYLKLSNLGKCFRNYYILLVKLLTLIKANRVAKTRKTQTRTLSLSFTHDIDWQTEIQTETQTHRDGANLCELVVCINLHQQSKFCWCRGDGGWNVPGMLSSGAVAATVIWCECNRCAQLYHSFMCYFCCIVNKVS